MDDQFRAYVRGAFRNSLYNLGAFVSEKRKEPATGLLALQSKKAHLRGLDQLADELSERAVAELEGLGMNSPDDLIAKGDLVKEKLRAVQCEMQRELGSK